MLMSFAFAIVSVMALLGSQTLLKLEGGPVPLRDRSNRFMMRDLL